MSIASDLLGLVNKVSQIYQIPAIERIFIPEPVENASKLSNFGLLQLEDGSSGLFYTMLDPAQQGFDKLVKQHDLEKSDPVSLASRYLSDSQDERSISLAAINAITEFAWKKLSCRSGEASDSLGELELKPGDHLGMVGYFAPLLQRIEQKKISLTILEKKDDLPEIPDFVRLTHTAADLEACNKVLCTASTLLNNSLSEILAHSRHAEAIVLIGPTAGCFPDPLFKRGVTAIGGSRILNPELAVKRLKSGESLADSVSKFLIRRSQYEGLLKLLENR